jgi:hypothetical protein
LTEIKAKKGAGKNAVNFDSRYELSDSPKSISPVLTQLLHNFREEQCGQVMHNSPAIDIVSA